MRGKKDIHGAFAVTKPKVRESRMAQKGWKLRTGTSGVKGQPCRLKDLGSSHPRVPPDAVGKLGAPPHYLHGPPIPAASLPLRFQTASSLRLSSANLPSIT